MKELTDTPMPEGIRLEAFRPVSPNVLVRVLPPAERTKGGLYLPPARLASDEDAPEIWWRQGEPPYVGEVVSVGAGEHCVAPGDRVAFVPNAGVTFCSGGERYLLIEEPCFLAREVAQ